MDYLHTFESLNESKDLETLKKKVLDFAEKKGKSRWKDLHSFILKQKGLDPADRDNRGQFSSYFSGGSWLSSKMGWDKNSKGKHGRSYQSHGLLMRPTKKDPRYLDKVGSEYVVKVWDGKGNLPLV